MLPRHSIADAIRARIERLLHRPSTTVWLHRVSIRTDRFDESLIFYTNLLGLSLDEVTIDPETGYPRAHLLDATGNEILQIEETVANEATSSLKIAFSMPTRVWYLFRSRLESRGYNYEDVGGILYLRDTIGTPIQVKALDDDSFQAWASETV